MPRTELHSDSRIENMVLAAPTNMVPTAIGRTMLYQTVYAAIPESLVPRRRGRSGSKNNSSGIKIHQATTPPATLMAANCDPIMYPIPISAGERLGVDHGMPPECVTATMVCFS